MFDILSDFRSKGPLEDSDMTVAAQLLRIRDPKTGKPLPDDRIAAEIGVLFTGGFETTGHTIAWAMWDLFDPDPCSLFPNLLSQCTKESHQTWCTVWALYWSQNSAELFGCANHLWKNGDISERDELCFCLIWSAVNRHQYMDTALKSALRLSLIIQYDVRMRSS